MKSKTTFAKRAFALLIAALMLVSILPAAVAAENGTTDYTAIEGIEWIKGFVSPTGELKTSNDSYSLTSVFVIEKAGTVVTFTDTDGSFASSGAAVFTGWNLVDGEWVFDSSIVFNGANSSIYKDVNGTRVYYYVTTKDNQGLRISYRSEQTDDLVPEHVTVYTTSHANHVNWLKENMSCTAPAALQNGTYVQVTNFSDIGEGKTQNAVEAKLSRKDNGAIIVERDGGWLQQFDWAFDEAQDWTGMTGILVKVDYTNANTNVDTGHGLMVGIHTENGSAAAFNHAIAGGSVYANGAWNPMISFSTRFPGFLSVNPNANMTKYAGYIFIPASAYTVEGLDSVTALTIKSGAMTSGTTVIEGIWLVKAADVSAELQNSAFVPVTNFNEIGAGSAAALNGATATVGANGLNIERGNDDWQQEIDWTFAAAQNWTGMTGVLVKVDFTSANTNTNSGNGGHGVTIGIKTANGTTFNKSGLGGFAFMNSTNSWAPMGACKNYSDLLVVTPSTINRYSGYVYIPAAAFGAAGVAGLESVTGLTIYNGAMTSGKSVIEEIWLVKEADTSVSVKMEGYQDTTAQGGNTYDVRFLATINTLNVESYGFVVTASYLNNGEKVVHKSYADLTTVYTGVLAAGEEQNAAAGEYFAPMTMKGIPADLEVCFTVTPYVVCTDGTIVCDAPATYIVNAD